MNFQRVLSFFNKPLPAAGFSISALFKYFLIGIFVALFLLAFQPFGISEWQTPYKALKLSGFGLVSFLVPVIYSALLTLLVPKRIREDRWTIGKEIVSIIMVLVLIAAGNMLYNRMIGIMYLSFLNFLNAFVPVVLLGIFPVFFLVLTRHNRLFKRNVAEADKVNEQLKHETEGSTQHESLENYKPEKLILVAENEKDKLQIEPGNLLFIESADNYSNIVFLENGQVKRHLLRGSLKRLESQLNQPFIVRCHRTYIVNLQQVQKVEGNAAGYKLNMNAGTEPVPVSRGFGPAILEKLKSLT